MVIHTKTTDGGDHEFRFHVVGEKGTTHFFILIIMS